MVKDKNFKLEKDLAKYDKLDNLSLRDMNFGLWLSQKRQTFLRIIISFLVVLCVFFLVYSAYNYIIYFMNDDPVTDVYVPLSPRQVTEDLQVSAVEILPSGDSHDLAVIIKNPNEKFSVTFNYCFMSGDSNILCRSDFILPAAEKHILALSQDLPDGSGEIFLLVSDVVWRRFDAHQIPDWQSFISNHLNFEVTDSSFKPAATNGLSDKVNLSALDFSITNQTPYGYYQAPLNILLYNGSILVGVQRYFLSNFLPGEIRKIKLSWFDNLNNVTRTAVEPDINILDDNVYLKYQGATVN
ncbi:hypothetical protein GW920_01415 [Candidatus Falkowbacteria bacterium]|uniref:Uncharacterized protein n=1 Tax=Candidatus Falkowbacteria bacterium CG10_big_fil_rev_8_21_14_0_10_37_18 TaxID=1974562 RepID=A0A2H0V8J1_9BACT|nr:hypothetical protein [Candidatus Falkowbacteria bacterium]NCQ12905.1 hypothetical protein [Candidatus Falkowbacteria bacterium]OIO06358.1 MAG: hypothetical protein AUJ26_00940 [Candidatus Falkowbacteria bacterium CG1_02_37_21]PIR95398.1 MAG: hypothetical protein COT93_02585 [Candidatus Falkowbacteria bacterium CG10_big_fil_rev_8_21_14_0_10_37_18]